MFELMEFWAQKTVSPIDGRQGWTVVDECYVEHARVGEYLRVLLDGEGKSVGTARAYAGRLALYLTWAAGSGIDETSPRPEELAAFARWLERTPSRKHRPGRNRRRAPDPGVVSLAPARSPATVDGILVAVVEFVRFVASRGWTDTRVAGSLSTRMELRFLPAGFDPGERAGRPVMTRRLVRRRRVERPPMTFTARRSAPWSTPAATPGTGSSSRRCTPPGCGWPSCAACACRTCTSCRRPLIWVARRPGRTCTSCAGRTTRMARWPSRSTRGWCRSPAAGVGHDVYRAERDRLAEAAESDYLLVNLWRPPLGRALRRTRWSSCSSACRRRRAFTARPHMLRHSFASEVALATKDPALVKELLGHASVVSSDVYMHARWADMRAAVDAHSRAGATP